VAAPRPVGPKKLDETPKLPRPHVEPVQGAPGLNQLGNRPLMVLSRVVERHTLPG
jgi:hypothetical protein